MDSIITDMYGLARYCNFGALKRTAHSHHIVVGLQNPKISGKLQLDPNLTLEKATNLVRQRETVKQQQNILDGRFNSTPAHADGIAKGKSQDKSKEKPPNSSKEKNPDQKCQGALEICTQRKHVL